MVFIYSQNMAITASQVAAFRSTSNIGIYDKATADEQSDSLGVVARRSPSDGMTTAPLPFKAGQSHYHLSLFRLDAGRSTTRRSARPRPRGRYFSSPGRFHSPRNLPAADVVLPHHCAAGSTCGDHLSFHHCFGASQQSRQAQASHLACFRRSVLSP